MPVPRRLVFGSVAEEYEELRPSYPGALIDDIIGYAGCEPGDEVLEVGAGTGKATRLVAARGLGVTAVEPDPAMAAVASMRAATAAGHVRVVLSDFETAELPAGRFRLVFSAQAWHWVDPQRGLPLARRALRPGGGLAVFWNRVEWGRYAGQAGLLRAYTRSAVTIEEHGPMHPSNTTVLDIGHDWTEEIAAADGFDAPERRTYDWIETHTTDGYLRLLATHSDHILLEPSERERLFAEIRTTLDAGGGGIELPMNTVLCLARAA